MSNYNYMLDENYTDLSNARRLVICHGQKGRWFVAQRNVNPNGWEERAHA